MNCRRVEKLMPLYVAGDLASGMAERLASHLEWCGRCNWLADEYRESQSWLRSTEPPEFDDSALKGLKAGVLRRIEETNARPSMLASLVQHWSRRHVFALSAAAVIIFGMAVLYVYQTRAKVSVPSPELVELNPGEETARPDRPGLLSSTERHQPSDGRAHIGRAHIKRRSDPALAMRAARRDESRASATSVAAGVPATNTNTGPGASPVMLRIEMQTSDPNIRIIWFAPKETDPHQTKPATD